MKNMMSPTLEDKLEKSRQILKDAIGKYNPSVILVGFSGGNDSTCCVNLTSMICKELNKKFAVFHCNTGIGIEETREYVREQCRINEWEYIEELPPYKTYEELVLNGGFPGPATHTIMYATLKERSIRLIVRRYPKKSNKMIITGVRSSESARRFRNIPGDVQKDGRKIWVNLIRHFDVEDMEEFRDIYKIPINEVTEKMGMSGECMCGAYAKPGELEQLKKHYPATYDMIMAIEKKARAKGFTWGWEEQPPTGMAYLDIMEKIKPGYKEKYLEKMLDKRQKKTGQMDMFQPLCHHCNVKHDREVNKKKAGF